MNILENKLKALYSFTFGFRKKNLKILKEMGFFCIPTDAKRNPFLLIRMFQLSTDSKFSMFNKRRTKEFKDEKWNKRISEKPLKGLGL